MKIFAPGYYKKFRCIADLCRHSCCVGWRVGITDEFCDRLGTTTLAPLLYEHLAEDSDGKYIKMANNGRCPFLSECGLCDIISTVGEAYLADICAEHPRFYNNMGDRLEVGLGLSCEEAARLVLSSDDFAEMVEVGEYDGEAVVTEYDTSEARVSLLAMIADEAIPYPEIIRKIEGEYRVSAHLIDDVWGELFGSLEYLREDSRPMMTVRRVVENCTLEIYMRRFLAYLIYRHTGEVDSHLDLRARVGFALVGVAAFESMLAHSGVLDFSGVVECARIFSEEIEYSLDNTDAIIFEISGRLL